MSLRGHCPVCDTRPIQPILNEFVIRVAIRGHPQQPIGGLEAYECENGKHIFFVMAKDAADVSRPERQTPIPALPRESLPG